jgi:hypothetical protein
VTKLNASGSGLVYSTFLGGSGEDGGYAIALDGAGAATVTGRTVSTDFPTTPGAFDPSYNGVQDAFVTRLNASGSALLYSTFLGGSSWDEGWDIAVDASGAATVTGWTSSSNFPTTPGAFDPSFNGVQDAFVTRLRMPIDLGFRPNPDGYQFANYGGNYPLQPPDYWTDEAIRMFGQDAVCRMVLGQCVVKPSAWKWMFNANLDMNGGHCGGFTTTSLRFFKRLDNPSSFQTGANYTHDLYLANVRRHIAYYQVLNDLEPVASARDAASRVTPNEVLSQLQDALSRGDDPTALVFGNREHTKAHAVTPYAVVDAGGGLYRVRVYDSNHPDDANRYVVIDTIQNSWGYNLGWEVWNGDANTHTLVAIPISVYAQPPVCPWCGGTGAQVTTAHYQVWLDGGGHLLITDGQGRRIGFVGDQFVNEIPGAFDTLPLGGLGLPVEPIYSLPITQTYTILLDGQTLTQTNTVELTQFGPGYAIAIGDVQLASTSRDRVTVGPAGTQLAYQPNHAEEATLTIALDSAAESDRFTIHAADVRAGEPVTVSVNMSTGQLVFNNARASGGEYNLNVYRVNAAGPQLFVHTDITILATDTHYLDYGTWNGSEPMLLEIDHGSNGTIDEQIPLENQVRLLLLPLILNLR